MHECPECGQVCDCGDGDDTWNDAEAAHCVHECEEWDDDFDDEDEDDGDE